MTPLSLSTSAPPPPIYRVPKAVMAHVFFPMLDKSGRCMAARSCRNLRHAEDITFKYVTHLAPNESIDDAELERLLDRYPNVVNLDLGSCMKISPDGYRMLARKLTGRQLVKLVLPSFMLPTYVAGNLLSGVAYRAEVGDAVQDLLLALDWTQLQCLDCRKSPYWFTQVLLEKLRSATDLREIYFIAADEREQEEFIANLPPRVQNLYLFCAITQPRSLELLAARFAANPILHSVCIELSSEFDSEDVRVIRFFDDLLPILTKLREFEFISRHLDTYFLHQMIDALERNTTLERIQIFGHLGPFTTLSLFGSLTSPALRSVHIWDKHLYSMEDRELIVKSALRFPRSVSVTIDGVYDSNRAPAAALASPAPGLGQIHGASSGPASGGQS
jgi:hypothetical protein